MFTPAYKECRILLVVGLICAILICMPHAVGAASPSLSNHKFYGTVHYNGRVVGAGYVVTAMVDGKEVASATTDDQGKWGVSQPFTVATAGCALVEFYVNGELVGTAASCIETNELNLTAPRLLQSSASTASVDSTAAGAISMTTDSQPSAGSTDSASSSLLSTATFIIGPQPSSASSPSDSSFSQPLHSTVVDSQHSPIDTSLASTGSEAVPPSVGNPAANEGLKGQGASTVPAGAVTAAHLSIIEIMVISGIVIWSIIIVIVLLLIVRKRSYY
jgi:hypothetical protein